jgi:hypothetical protein
MYLMFATSSLRAANITAVFCDISVTCRQLKCCHFYLVQPNFTGHAERVVRVAF